MAYFYGSTLVSFLAAEAAMVGTAVGAIHELPLHDHTLSLAQSSLGVGQDTGASTVSSECVVFDPSEDVRKKFEVDLTIDSSRFGMPKVGAYDHSPLREETWFAAAGEPTEPRGIFPAEFDRARELFRSGQDEGAFEILHGAVGRAKNPIQARMALIRAHVALEEVFGEIPLDSTTAFETRVEDLALQRRYFVLMREIWRFRSRFLSEALLPDMTTADEKRRLVSWAQELQKRAKHFHVDLAEDESRRGDQLAANRRHQDRADELAVQEALFVHDFRTAKALLDLLLTQNDEARPSDPERQLREYRLYRLGVAIYQSLGDRKQAQRFFFRSPVLAGDLLKFDPDRAIQDLLRAAEELSISDEHETEELNFIADILSHQMDRIERGLSHQMHPEHILRGFFPVVARMIEVLIRQTPLSERRAQIGELQVLREDVMVLGRNLPHWQEGADLEAYLGQGRTVLWELKLILVRSKMAAGSPEQAAALLLVYITGVPQGDHARLYKAYRLLEEMNDAAGRSTDAMAARLQAEAHAQVLRARGEEVES